jgi:hypothetical protein
MEGILTCIAHHDSRSTVVASRTMQKKTEERGEKQGERCERELLDAPAVIYVISSGA